MTNVPYITVNDTAMAAKSIYKNLDVQDERFVLTGGFFDPKNDDRLGFAKDGDAGGASTGLYKFKYHANMYIISIRGSKGKKDWVDDDVSIGAGNMPDRASDCVKYVNGLKQIYKDSFLLLVGHSLGGYLAQVVGVKCDLPFVTYNAPPALGTFSGKIAGGTAAHKFRQGLNFRVNWDPVSKAPGSHIGPVVKLPHVGFNVLNAHTNGAIEKSMAQAKFKDMAAMAFITASNRA